MTGNYQCETLSGMWAQRNVAEGTPFSALQWSGWGRGLAVEQLLRRHSRSREEHMPLSNNWPGNHPIDGGRIRRLPDPEPAAQQQPPFLERLRSGGLGGGG